MNYEQTLHYLYNKLPLYSQIGRRAYKADLTNTLALCKHLSNPEKKLACIHVAGTNGKGSTSHMLAAIYQQAGYKTGLYTSPHLRDFRERIRVNGEMVPEDFVVSFTENIRSFSEEISPSFFELTFVLAVAYFAQQQTDIAIIETGLGGRLDSTNVITPALSVITNIGFDHMDILGNTLEKIAFEKAGIIKKNVPVVIGESTPATSKVFIVKAKQENADIIFAEEKLEIGKLDYSAQNLSVELIDKKNKGNTKFFLDLNGGYQQKNLRTAITAVNALGKKFPVEVTDMQAALRQVKKLTGLFGRWEVLEEDPLLVLDVAHNQDGFGELLQQVSLVPHEKLHVVIGLVKDKKIENVLKQLPAKVSYYFTRAHIPRAMPEDELQKLASTFGLRGETFPDVNIAIEAAKNTATKEDLILVCGSVFVIGEVDLTIKVPA